MNHIQEILKKNNLSHCNVTEIGHHQLNRNNVYYIKDDKEYILKIFNNPIKYECEKRGLEIFKENPFISRIKSYGEEEFYWIITEKIEGDILGKTWTSLNLESQKTVIQLVGELLGQIHQKKKETYFGGWEDMPQKPIFYDFIEYRQHNDESIMNRINSQKLPDQRLFNKAYDTIKKYYKYLNPQPISTITHRDFSYRNMVVKKENHQIILSGLIDFEHCQMDDPCIDFNTLFQYDMLHNEALESLFFKSYNKYMDLPEDFQIRKKYYMINLGLHTCSWSFNVAKDFYANGIDLLNKLL